MNNKMPSKVKQMFEKSSKNVEKKSVKEGSKKDMSKMVVIVAKPFKKK